MNPTTQPPQGVNNPTPGIQTTGTNASDPKPTTSMFSNPSTTSNPPQTTAPGGATGASTNMFSNQPTNTQPSGAGGSTSLFNTQATTSENPTGTATAGATARPQPATTTGSSALFSGGAGARLTTPAGTTTANTAPTQPQPGPATQSKEELENSLLMNKYLSDVMNKWKDTMKEQVEEFQKVAVDIRKNEAEMIKHHQLVHLD